MRPAVVLLAVPLLVAACGDDADQTSTAADATTTTTTTTVTPSYEGDPSLPDPGGTQGFVFDVEGALTVAHGNPITVRGHLIALPDGTAELCGGPVQESAPPRCADPALPVDGLDGALVQGVTDHGDWAEGDVELRGRMDGGRLVVGDA